jgi:hypothetical protein
MFRLNSAIAALRPAELTRRETCMCWLVPGFAFLKFGRPLMGKLTFLFCIGAVLLSISRIGTTSAIVAYGLIITIHAISILRFLEIAYQIENFAKKETGHFVNTKRLFYTVALTFILAELLYLPLQKQITKRWILPLEIQGQLIRVNACASPHSLGRGDMVAYHIPYEFASEATATPIREGYGIKAIFGIAGDRISFSSTAVFRNGAPFPRERGMPIQGEVIVPEKHWFIWPDFTISRGDINMINFPLKQATVSETKFVGTPFSHWLFIPQKLP